MCLHLLVGKCVFCVRVHACQQVSTHSGNILDVYGHISATVCIVSFLTVCVSRDDDASMCASMLCVCA